MAGESLAPLNKLREQADARAPDVKAPALLHIARVESTLDEAAAWRTFNTGIELARKIDKEYGHALSRKIRMLAAAVAPSRLDEIPAPEVGPPHVQREQLIGIMIEHGHIAAAVSYAMKSELSDFPQFRLTQLMRSTPDAAVQLALLRRAVEAWRHGSHHAAHRGHADGMWFVQSFQRFWNLLPTEEARDLLREIVDRASRQPPNWSGTWDPEGTVRIDSPAENSLFYMFDVIRALDPALAGSLPAQHAQLAAALRRFPDGYSSVLAEAEQRKQARLRDDPDAPGGYCFAGNPRDFPYMRSLMDAGRTGDFEPAIAHALDRYDEDTETNRNYAPKDLWPSTDAFRAIAHRAGRRLGANAGALLERIPDADMRLLAAIELEAALHGLPQFISITSHRPAPRRRRGLDNRG